MSEVYIREPANKGKVCLHTSAGDIDIELWAKEAPKACRNFVTLCMEGYYNQTIFHRVIKDFMVQGGDPTGTGQGGESIYGAPFGNEIHPRLRFRYRGLVGMANAGRGTVSNASQFFITLSRADGLDGLHTLFGKVTGHTVYNVLKMAEGVIDPKTDRPADPPRILSAEILWNPFDDIVLRQPASTTAPSEDSPKKPEKRDELKTTKKQLLSFEEDEEEEGGDETHGGVGPKKIVVQKRSQPPPVHSVDHDSGDDGDSARLEDRKTASSGQPSQAASASTLVTSNSVREAILRAKQRTLGTGATTLPTGPRAPRFPTATAAEGTAHNGGTSSLPPDTSLSTDGESPARSNSEIQRDHSPPRAANAETKADGEDSSENEGGINAAGDGATRIADAASFAQRDALTLKKQGQGSSTKKNEAALKASLPDSDLMTEYEKTLYAHRAKKYCQKSNRERQKETLSRLNSFTAKLRTLNSQPVDDSAVEESSEDHAIRALPNLDEVVEENDGAWAARQLNFPIDSARAYEIDAAKDALVVIDPLNTGDAQKIGERKAAFDELQRKRRRERAKPSLRRDGEEKW